MSSTNSLKNRLEARIGRKRDLTRIAYITHNGKLLTYEANPVGVVNMCSQFAALGLETELIIPRGEVQRRRARSIGQNDVWKFYGVPRNFRIRHFPVTLCRVKKISKTVLSVFLVLYCIVRRHKLVTTRSIEVAYWAARFRLPVIFESHNFLKVQDHRLLPRWVDYTKADNVEAMMVVTTSAAKHAYLSCGVPEERIRVERNGVAIERFNEELPKRELRESLGLPTDETIVGFSGSLYSGRGIEELLQTAAYHRGLAFLIVGGAPDHVRHYRVQAQRLGLANVVFVGYVSQPQVPLYLLASDILIMPNTSHSTQHSIEYMSPMKLFEYLAAARPIVATRLPTVCEVLTDGHNAVIVEPDNAKALARGISTVLGESSLAERIAAQARQDAEHYSWRNRAARIIAWQHSVRSQIQGGNTGVDQ